jgi:hypothetical protein
MSFEKKLFLWGGGAIAFIIIIGSLGWLSGPSQPNQNAQALPSSTGTAEVKSKDQLAKENKRFEQCKAKLKKAQKLDLLHDLTIDPLPRVIVGPTFYTITLDAKQGFADTVNCFLMTGQESYINFDLLDYQTGHVVAEYSYGKLSVK